MVRIYRAFRRSPSLPHSVLESKAFWKEKKRMMIESRVRERERKKKRGGEARKGRTRRCLVHPISFPAFLLCFDPPKRR
jgi:hypothetical protein